MIMPNERIEAILSREKSLNRTVVAVLSVLLALSLALLLGAL
jgi:hypothetical protein